ncbi:unnamed protein product, partial [Darwinula stevensoni]
MPLREMSPFSRGHSGGDIPRGPPIFAGLHPSPETRYVNFIQYNFAFHQADPRFINILRFERCRRFQEDLQEETSQEDHPSSSDCTHLKKQGSELLGDLSLFGLGFADPCHNPATTRLGLGNTALLCLKVHKGQSLLSTQPSASVFSCTAYKNQGFERAKWIGSTLQYGNESLPTSQLTCRTTNEDTSYLTDLLEVNASPSSFHRQHPSSSCCLKEEAQEELVFHFHLQRSLLLRHSSPSACSCPCHTKWE